MATKNQIEMLLARMEKAHPDDFFKKIDDSQAGICAVLRLLQKTGKPITAGKISDVLNISTARVAVLLKKMVAKGLITKEQGVIDGRTTVVHLTESGEKTISELQTEIYNHTAYIIDTVGQERILEFITIAEEIRDASKEPDFKF